MKVSGIVIAKNEEKNLGRCLESIAPVCDEIVVVDTGSEDATREIAGRLASRVLDFPWENDFSSARNFALRQASGDVVFTLDADEAVSDKDYPAFRALIEKQGLSAPWGLSLPVRNYVAEPMDFEFVFSSGEYPEMEKGYAGYVLNFRTLVFPNRTDIYYRNAIHESVEASLLSLGAPPQKGAAVIHNFGYGKRNIDAKDDVYELLLRKELDRDPENFKKNYDYGHFLFCRGREKEALPYLEKAYVLNKKIAGRVAYFLGAAYFNLRENAKAKEIFQSLVIIKDPGVFRYLVRLALREKDPRQALQHARSGLRLAGGDEFLLKAACEIYASLGKDKLAKEYLLRLEKSIKDKKEKTQCA